MKGEGDMRIYRIALAAVIVAAALTGSADALAKKKVKVVATVTTYGYIARQVGGDRVQVETLVKGDQDPHFVQPKLSLAEKLAAADVFIDTGLDLEMWVPALQDAAGNKKIQSGAVGYISASKGCTLLEVPKIADRKEGDVHIYGNPHLYNSPIAQRQIAMNIATGLGKVDPEGKDLYKKNARAFVERIDEALFGPELVKILGGDKLAKLAEKGKLVPFLESNTYKDRPLIDFLGGWLEKAMPLRGKKIVAYHKNWAYFSRIFGFSIIEFVEPKPGIPPSPKHVKKVVETIKKNDIKVLLAATYYDMSKVKAVANKSGVTPVIVGITVDGQKGQDDVFKVTESILDKLLAVYAK
jgi:ABC-type Zn uptake system ZnuABC Zn-binding protein ZnuA